jgi:putative ABC transport system permease protein
MFKNVWLRLQALFFKSKLKNDLEEGTRFNSENEVEGSGVQHLEEVWQDLRYAVRRLIKKPAFTLTAVLTLALGIGANTAIFSVVSVLLLSPLPLKEPQNLVWFWGVQPQLPRADFAPADFLDYQKQNNSFAEMAALSDMSVTLTGTGQPERIDVRIVSANYFSLLGVEARIGGGFASVVGKAGAARVAVLSDSFWRTHFGADRNAIGKTMVLNGESVTVIGIAPSDFKEPPVELWINPRQIAPDFSTTYRDDILAVRNRSYLQVIGRLKPGVSLAQAQTDINSIAARLQQQYPQTNAVRGVHLVSLREKIAGDLRQTVFLLFGAVGMVLLIASTNIANIIMVQTTARRREIAIRMALGARRWRIIRQLLVETVLLACLGGGLAWLLAGWGRGLLPALSPSSLPYIIDAPIDYRVFTFTLLLSLIVGLAAGIFPALTASKIDINQTLKDGGGSAGPGGKRYRLHGALVIAEVALALVVLIGAGLLIKSFIRLQKIETGFNPNNLTTMLVWLSDAKYSETKQRVAFLRELRARLQVLPGAQSVAIANVLPVRGNGPSTYPFIEGRPVSTENERIRAGIHAVSPGYFQVMGIPLRMGREFTDRDDENSTLVTLVNETAAGKFWPGEDVLGKRIKLGGDRGPWIEVVGVVGDVKYDGLIQESGPHIYVSHMQVPWPTLRIAIRSQLEAAALTATVRREVTAIDSTQPVSDVRTMEEIISRSAGPRRFAVALFSFFAVVSLLLAAIGLYSILAFTVTARSQEIGVRMALGALRSNVLRLVIGQGMRLTLAGIIIGLIGAVALTRLMKDLLYGVAATDPLTFVAIALLLGFVALIACLIPAKRATKVDPLIAIRHE